MGRSFSFRCDSGLARMAVLVALLVTTTASLGARFQRIGTAQGLSQPSILCAHHGPMGFLWFCTQEGLNRFDGHQFRVFRQAQVTGLPDSFMQSLVEDANQVFWIGTNYGGLGRFDPRTERYQPVPLFDGPQDFAVQELLIDRDGRIWAGTDRFGLWRLDSDGSNPRQILAEVDVTALLQASNGSLWIGTYASGLWQLPDGTLRPRQVSVDPPRVRTLTQLPDRTIWAGSDDGITAFHAATGATLRRSVPQLPDVMDLFVDRENRVWIGTAGGLYRRSDASGDLEYFGSSAGDPYSLSEDFVETIYEDRDGNFWIGTWLGGVNLLPATESPFELLKNDPEATESWNHAATSMVEGQDGRLWVAMYRGVGIAQWDEVTGRFLPLIEPHERALPGTDHYERILGLDPESGRIWTVANNGYLSYLDPGEDRLQQPDAQPLLGAVAEEVHLVGERMVVATRDKGVILLDKNTLDELDRLDSQDGVGEYVQAVLMQDDRIWLGTSQGVIVYDLAGGSILRTINRDQGLGHNSITALWRHSSGDIWIGTQGGGLHFLTTTNGVERLESINARSNGLASDAIGGIREDADGNLWVSTAAGLTRITVQGALRNFAPGDGLPEGGFFIGSHFSGASGRLYFGGQGVLAVDPGEYRLPDIAPRVTLTDYLVRNQRVATGTHLEHGIAYLPAVTVLPDDFLVSFRFSALSFEHAADIRYSHRIAALDDAWVTTLPGRNTATYTRLPAGNLTFEVRASFDGVHWGPVTELAIRSLAPPWRTWWAYLLYLVVGSLAIGLPARARVLRLRERREHQREVENSEMRLRMALWGSGDELWYYDARKREVHLTYFDQDSQEFVDDEPEDAVQSASVLHPEDRDKLLSAIDDHVEGKSEYIEVMYRRWDGSDRWHWYLVRGIAVAHDRNGEVTLIAGTRRDVHRRMSAMLALEELAQHLEDKVDERTSELEHARDRLVESEKMAALGNLVAGVAHELNTPIGITLTAASHLKDKLDAFLRESRLADEHLMQTLRDGMEMVLKNMDRATDLIQSFKRVAVDQTVEQTSTFDLATYVDDIVTSLRPVYKNRYEVRVECRDSLVVHTYPSALYQIVQNLVMNSATHGFEGVESPAIDILFRCEEHDLVLDYRDNGTGISAEVREHIFEPFVTTARHSGSSGLGMHIVYNLVTQLFGGTIECRDAEGGGASFEIRIPLQQLKAMRTA